MICGSQISQLGGLRITRGSSHILQKKYKLEKSFEMFPLQVNIAFYFSWKLFKNNTTKLLSCLKCRY